MNTVNTGPSIKSYKKLNLWFNFDKSNVLQIYSGKVDIGQHISSTLALICSQITGVNYNQIEIIKLDTDISPDEGITASSLSVAVSGTAIKAASFTLRKEFYNYAINNYNILEDNILFENGVIKDKLSNKSVTYWDFATTNEFKELKISDTLIDSEITEYINKNTQSIEIKTIHDIVTGQYKYVHDLNFPNMLHARIVRPPNYHSKFIKINENFIQILNQNNVKLFIKGSFIALLSIEEFLVVKYLDIIKKQIIWKDVKDLSNENIFISLSNNQKNSLLVKAGGEAYQEKIPNIKDFNDSKTFSLSTHGSYMSTEMPSLFKSAITSTTFVFLKSGQFSLNVNPMTRTLVLEILISCSFKEMISLCAINLPMLSLSFLPAKITFGL